MLAYALGAVVLLAILAGIAIVARGGLAPPRRGAPMETAQGAKLLQRDRKTGELLWEVRVGDVTREAGSDVALVTGVECVLYTGGLEEMVVRSPELRVDAAEEILVFSGGCDIESGAGAKVAYRGRAERMIYEVKSAEVRLEDKAEFDYGRSKFCGSMVSLHFGREGDTERTRLARCEVTPMAPENGRRAALAFLAIAAATAVAQPGDAPQQEQQFRNAILRADRMVADFAEGRIFLQGSPEVELGDTVFTADAIECQVDPEQPDRLIAAHTEGQVRIVSDELLEAATMAKPHERRRKVIVEARSAVYSAADGTARLEGGITGTFTDPGSEGSFTGSRLVAWFDAGQTLTKVTAYGGPASLHYVTGLHSSDGEERQYDFTGSEISYVMGDNPRLVAGGSPHITMDGGNNFSANSITAYIATREEDGAQYIDRALFEGSVVADMPGSSSSATLTAETAEVLPENIVRSEGVAHVRGAPKVILRNSRGVDSAEVTCDQADIHLGKEGGLEAKGNVRIRSLSSPTVVTADNLRSRPVKTTISGKAVGDGTTEFLLTGNPRGRREGDPAKGSRAVSFVAERLAFYKGTLADGTSTQLVVCENGTSTLEPLEEAEQAVVVAAPLIEFDDKSGAMIARNRVKLSQGDTTIEADRIETKQGEDGKIAEANAFGDIVMHGRSVRPGKTEADPPQVWLLEAHAERATMTPAVAVPEGLTRFAADATATRYRLTGNPSVSMAQEGGSGRSQFRNVDVIDIYPAGGGKVLVDVRGGQGPAELEVEKPSGDVLPGGEE